MTVSELRSWQLVNGVWQRRPGSSTTPPSTGGGGTTSGGTTTPPPPPTPPPTTPGTVLWEGSLDALAVGTSFTVDGTTVFLSKPWPYSSIQSAGNDTSHTATVSVANDQLRNARNKTSCKIVMQPGSQRLAMSSRGDPSPPFQGQWTPDGVGSIDHWYGWSMLYGSDWGSTTTLNAENTGTIWNAPIAWRMSPTVIGNGSMNVSGDENDSNGSANTPVSSTPRTLYLRRNSVLDQSGYWTDGLGLDKIPMGQVVVGQWMDFVVHVRWSTTTTNALREVWRDGVLMGRKTSMNAVMIDTATKMSDSHSWRIGPYQETVITHTRTQWFSNIRIGTSYAAVDPASVT